MSEYDDDNEDEYKYEQNYIYPEPLVDSDTKGFDPLTEGF